jgi:type III secretion protein T
MMTGAVRNGVLLMLALFMSPVAGDLPTMHLLTWALMAAKEAVIGLLLGLGFGIFIWAIQSVGDLIDFQTGSGNASFFDPAAGHENGPTGEFLGWLVITLFVAAGGLLAMVGVLLDSYRIWPVASFYPDPGEVLEQFAIRQGDTLFLWIVKLASPVLLVLLLVELGMGLISRVAPQLNVFVFAQPLKSLLATLMIMLFLFFLYESLQEFLRPENGVLEFLRIALQPLAPTR